MNRFTKFFKEKISSLYSSIIASKSKTDKVVALSLAEARQLLPEYKLLRSQTIMPDGKIVASLFIDHVPDSDYILAKLLKYAKRDYEIAAKKYECRMAGKSKEEVGRELEGTPNTRHFLHVLLN